MASAQDSREEYMPSFSPVCASLICSYPGHKLKHRNVWELRTPAYSNQMLLFTSIETHAVVNSESPWLATKLVHKQVFQDLCCLKKGHRNDTYNTYLHVPCHRILYQVELHDCKRVCSYITIK